MRPSTKCFITCLCVAILAGCGVTSPSKFYLLTPIEDSQAATLTAPGPDLGIGPVGFPAYLDRPEIAHRSGDNQLHFAGSHRWAEPLKTTFSRTLAENLSILLPGSRITLHPWPRSTPVDYQVLLDVTRFDADASGAVTLSASWETVRADGKTGGKRQKATYNEAAGGMAYPAIVAAQSRALARLSRDIAATLASPGAPQGQ
jgi:uncharacterized lipoprotein YmbA